MLAAKKIVKVMNTMAKKAPRLEFGITTNGLLLKSKAGELVNSNLSEVIVSLDTLRKDRFKQITGEDGLNLVIEGIREIKKHIPVRLNTLLMKDTIGEAWGIVDFAIKNKVNVKFLDLDYFRTPGEKYWSRHFIPITGFVNELKREFPKHKKVWGVGHTGIPMDRFEADGVVIRTKDSTRGTHYTNGCEGCRLHPKNAGKHYCQEGLFEMFLTSDAHCTICKHRKDRGVDLKQYGFDNVEKLEEGLSEMLNFYVAMKFRSNSLGAC